MQTNECFVCGSNDFTVTDGAFICNECGIQSQTIREEQITLNDNIMTVMHDDMVDKDHKITIGSQIEKGKKLLSWECFNLIILGLTKEIIELGAKPSLQVIVLQLWVRYLQCIEAAFTSKKIKKIPKLNIAINNIDCEILYGVENIKSKILYAKTGIKIQKTNKCRSNKRKSLTSNNSGSFSALSTNQKRLRINQNLRKIEKPATNLNNDSIKLSDDVSLLQRSMKSSKIKIKLTKDVKKSLRSMPTKTVDLTNEESSMLVKSSKKCWNKLKHKEKKNLLTIKKIISIIQLALMINNDDIYLSDILRWIREGHFHVNRVNLFLPENTVHGINFSYIVHNSSRTGLNMELAMLLNNLEVNQLPNIDFKKLVIRFCDELQLPGDFRHFVCKLILISPPNLKFTYVLPDVEVKVMAYILFAAKFLFCLDGNAENLSSDFAEKINKSNKVDTKLFNWNDYMQFIECRNSIISQYNYLLHKSIFGNNIRNTQIFVNDWNIMKSTLPLVENEKLSKGFRDNTELLLKSLPDIERKRSYREIPASTKPLSSTLKWIFEYYSMQLSVEAKRILENNFTQTDILYLTDEKRIYDLARECNIPIKVNCNKPLHYMKQTNKDPDTKCPESHTDKTKVYLINKPRNKNEQNETLKNSHKEEKPNTIFLGIGLNYWFIHMNKYFFKKTEITKLNTILKQKLPYSFLWFINLCCMIVHCPLSQIYLELMNIETELTTFLKTDETTSQKECEDMFSNISL